MAAQPLLPVVHYLRKLATPAVPAVTDAELLKRFVAHHEEAAFTALVRRYGPMVFAVCLRIVRDAHTAEDAFQATFLVLARKAASLRQPELLGPWLYGVASRTARKAKIETARRYSHERQAVRVQEVEPDDECEREELRVVLDEEIQRLPERYRVPVVLCYLQGQTNAQAADRLGCSRGTVATLLARAREKLRRRLAQRGIGLSIGAALAALAESVNAGVVSIALEQSIGKAAVLLAAGQTQAAGALAAQAVVLAKAVCKGMLMEKLKITAVILMLTALVGTGTGIGVFRAGAQETEPADAEAKPQTPSSSKSEPPRPHVTAPIREVKEKEAAYRTPNFLVTAPTPEIAEKVGRVAEDHRKALARLWLDKELPAWDKPCPLRVRVTTEPGSSQSTFTFDGGRVLQREMRVEGSVNQIFADLLPCETTHLILADWHGRPLPRWADEGAAMLGESREGRLKYQKHMEKIVEEKRLLSLRDLLPKHDYPRDVMNLYAQGLSLTDFLVSSGSRKKFLAFVAQGEDEGWDKAAQSHYGYKTVDVLEYAWLQDVQGQMANKEPPQRGNSRDAKEERRRKERTIEGRLPTGPAPESILVKLNEEGELIVKRKFNIYQPETKEEVLKNGTKHPVTSYKHISVDQLAIFNPKSILVYNTKGNELELKEWSRRLKGETLALISVDGRPVDALQLRLYKDDTLVFLIPQPPQRTSASETAVPAPPAAPTVGPNFPEQYYRRAFDPTPTPPVRPVPVAPPPAAGEPK
jgi:RNA polymerase sigma factor (sigma-70 family)